MKKYKSEIIIVVSAIFVFYLQFKYNKSRYIEKLNYVQMSSEYLGKMRYEYILLKEYGNIVDYGKMDSIYNAEYFLNKNKIDSLYESLK